MLETAQVKILCVPVAPLKAQTFKEILAFLKHFQTLELSQSNLHDTPFSGQFSQGKIHYKFCTEYDESFQEIVLSRRYFGILGLFNCDEVLDISKVHGNFSSKYPHIKLRKCIGFEASGGQHDTLSEIALINKDDNIHRRLEQIFSDFTKDVIAEFGDFAANIQKLKIIQGPVLLSPQFLEELDSVQNPSEIMNQKMYENSEKAAKRTPARAKKLLGDMYLLAGRLDLALGSLQQAIDLAKEEKDYQWRAAALDTFCITQLLSKLYQAGAERLPDMNELFFLANGYRPLADYLVEIPDKYREILTLYEKPYQFGSFGYYPIYQIEVCLKVAKFLVGALNAEFKGGFLATASVCFEYEEQVSTLLTNTTSKEIANKFMTKLTDGGSGNQTAQKLVQTAFNQDPTRKLRTSVSRFDIMVWIHRAANSGHDFLMLKDQIRVISSICGLCDDIGSHRKQSFYLRILAGIIQKANNDPKNSFKLYGPHSGKRAALYCIEKQCALLESGFVDESKSMDTEEVWVEKYGSAQRVNSAASRNWKRFGWPELQIKAYQDAILLADADADFYSVISHCTKLLSKMYNSLYREEIEKYSDMLQNVVMFHRKQYKTKKLSQSRSMLNLIHRKDSITLGVPVLTKMELVPPGKKYEIAQHKSVNTEKSSFLYSPFQIKKNKKEYAADDMINIDVTLANPLSFEIDIQMLELCGSGIQFKALSVSTLVPAMCFGHVVRLVIIPLEEGTLEILGVNVRMIGGCVEDTLIPIQKHPFYVKRFNETGFPKSQPLQDMNHKKELGFFSPIPTKSEPRNWNLFCACVASQPILELVETSLGSHKAITVFHGERSSMHFKIKNIGKVPINYVYMQITDIISDTDDKGGYEKGVYQELVRAFYPIESSDFEPIIAANSNAISTFSQVGILQPIKLCENIGVGDEITIRLGIFGKHKCTGGKILLNYGNFNHERKSDDPFYTRQLSFEILLTVVDALKFDNVDMLSTRGVLKYSEHSAPVMIADPTTESGEAPRASIDDIMLNPRISTTTDSNFSADSMFLLTFDIRNEWDEPFKLTFDIYNNPDDNMPSTSSTTIVHSGVTKRIILPIKKIKLGKTDLEKARPVLPGKQFLVSDGTSEEIVSKALFWYREELIGGLNNRGRLVARWAYSNGRAGFMSFRALRIQPAHLAVIRSDTIRISVEFKEEPEKNGNNFECNVNQVYTLVWTITNLESSATRQVLRICPVQESSTGLVYHNSTGVTIIGTSSQLLPEIGPMETISKSTKIIFKMPGIVNIMAHVQKVDHADSVKDQTNFSEIHWLPSGLPILVRE